MAEKKSNKKPTYSYSQVETGKCARKFHYEYREKQARELTYNLVAGSMLDRVFNAYYEGNQHLSDTHEQRMKYARAALALEAEDHPEWKTLQWSKKAGDPRSSYENFVWWLFDGGAAELVCRHDRGPVSVQMKLELELPQYKIIGYVDCFEETTKAIVDIKMISGWSEVSTLQYALRAQVPLYRMLMNDLFKIQATGRYELLLGRKSPKLVTVPDYDIAFLQDRLVDEFDAHHRMASGGIGERNSSKCFDYNRACTHFARCWPELTPLIPVKEAE